MNSVSFFCFPYVIYLCSFFPVLLSYSHSMFSVVIWPVLLMKILTISDKSFPFIETKSMALTLMDLLNVIQ